MPADMTKMAMHEEHFTISRDGDSIKEINVMEGVEYTFNLKLNEAVEWSDKPENPRFHLKVIILSSCIGTFVY